MEIPVAVDTVKLHSTRFIKHEQTRTDQNLPRTDHELIKTHQELTRIV